MGIDPNNPQQPHEGDPAGPGPQPYDTPQPPPATPYQTPSPYQQPASYQPPEQPYNPPPGSYQQGPGTGGQFTGASFNQAYGEGGAPPPPGKTKGGFNWLLCCGVSCGVMVLIFIVMMVFFGKMIKDLVAANKGAEAVAIELGETDIATIQGEAIYIDAPSVAANPDAYMDQWLAVEGVISANQAMASRGSDQGTSYVVDGGLIITDTSYNAPVGVSGETIVAYGKLMIIDISAIPGLQALMDQAAKEDPTMAGMFQDGKMMMFLAKQVVPAGGEQPTDPDAAGWGQ